MLEFWNDAKDKKTKILLNPLFQQSIIPLFQMRSEEEQSYDQIYHEAKTRGGD